MDGSELGAGDLDGANVLVGANDGCLDGSIVLDGADDGTAVLATGGARITDGPADGMSVFGVVLGTADLISVGTEDLSMVGDNVFGGALGEPDGPGDLDGIDDGCLDGSIVLDGADDGTSVLATGGAKRDGGPADGIAVFGPMLGTADLIAVGTEDLSIDGDNVFGGALGEPDGPTDLDG